MQRRGYFLVALSSTFEVRLVCLDQVRFQRQRLGFRCSVTMNSISQIWRTIS